MVYFNSKYNNVSKVTASRAITDDAITETTIFCNSKYNNVSNLTASRAIKLVMQLLKLLYFATLLYNNVSKVTASRTITDYAITETTLFCKFKYNNVFSFDFRRNVGFVTLTAMLSLIGVSFLRR
jgi:hypothetical protein